MNPKESLVYHAFRGLAAGLIGEAEAVAAAPGRPARSKPRKAARAKPPTQQMALSPELEKRLHETLVPLDPRSPMDDYQATPTLEQLDAMFDGREMPEQVQAFRRQMQAQADAAAMNGPQKKEPEHAPTLWPGIPDR